jgi:uncharacterized membrane protein
MRPKGATLRPVFGFDVGGFVLGTILISVLVPLLITVFVIVMVVWSIRRAMPSMPSGDNAAIQELRDRFARGEIDQAEYQARMDTLKGKA